MAISTIVSIQRSESFQVRKSSLKYISSDPVFFQRITATLIGALNRSKMDHGTACRNRPSQDIDYSEIS